jgi:DNA-binding GntR family transcriptional regulator
MNNSVFSRNDGLDKKSPPNAASMPLIEWAYIKIKEMIFQQKLTPGQKLVYKDLTSTLNISRTPIIIALSRLEQEGYVKSESYRGYYVKPLDLKEIWENFGIREALEVYSVEQAVIYAKPSGIALLEEKIEAHKNYMPTFYDKKKLFLDATVHIQLAEMTENKSLVHTLKANLEYIYLRLAYNTSSPDRMNPAVEEHRSLLEMIKRKDVNGSIVLMRKHIQNARDHIVKSLSREEKYQSL